MDVEKMIEKIEKGIDDMIELGEELDQRAKRDLEELLDLEW